MRNRRKANLALLNRIGLMPIGRCTFAGPGARNRQLA